MSLGIVVIPERDQSMVQEGSWQCLLQSKVPFWAPAAPIEFTISGKNSAQTNNPNTVTRSQTGTDAADKRTVHRVACAHPWGTQSAQPSVLALCRSLRSLRQGNTAGSRIFRRQQTRTDLGPKRARLC
jgi:hypothetical protein